ncbi:MAG: hypothetical protein ACK5LY_08170, partial [Lachnospirales bacterium]
DKEVLVRFNELSCYMHNKLFDLLCDFKQISEIREDSLYFRKVEIENKLTTFDINQLVNFGIFERMTGGMSFGGSSNNFDSLKLNSTFNEFVKKVYNIDVVIIPIHPCNFSEHKKLINFEMSQRLRFKDTPTIYKKGDGEKYEALIKKSKEEVAFLYKNVAQLESEYRSIQKFSYAEYIERLPQRAIDKKMCDKFDEEFSLWCQQLESSSDYVYLKGKYEVDTTDSNVTYI